MDSSDCGITSVYGASSRKCFELQFFAFETTASMSGIFHPSHISKCIFEKKIVEIGNPFFLSLKRMKLGRECVPIVEHVKHGSLCGGDSVY